MKTSAFAFLGLVLSAVVLVANEPAKPTSRVLVQQARPATEAEQKQKLCADLFYTLGAGNRFQAGILEGFEPAVVKLREKGVPETAIKEVRALVVRFGEELIRSPEFKKLLLKVYGEVFSLQELQEVVAFYRSAVGAKMLEAMRGEMSGNAKSMPSLTAQEQHLAQTFLQSAAGRRSVETAKATSEALRDGAVALMKARQPELEKRIKAVMAKYKLES